MFESNCWWAPQTFQNTPFYIAFFLCVLVDFRPLYFSLQKPWPLSSKTSAFQHLHSKIQTREEIRHTIAAWREQGLQVVFTNGCFDILHYGHIHYLAEASDLGDRLVIGMNAAESVRRLKGPNRPINDEQTRTHLLAALEFVDVVVLFEEDTPLELIQIIQPDVLVKGGDWQPAQIIGSDVVLTRGGKVCSLPYIEGYSTTRIEEKIKKGN